ncbi:MAG: preprotein translocase subunit SecE [Acidobacteriales bacterium]|nr:preprotein translocase subunit SecE [Terriglobales bacterium]
MAKTLTASAEEHSLGGRLKAWPERTRSFYHDVRTEMKKVTAPSFKEVQSTTAVVIITVFLFGVYFWAVDTLLGRAVDYMFRWFAHRG